MPKHSFKIGDIVKLKSGSPELVIAQTWDSSDAVKVQWFWKKKLCEQVVAHWVLEKAE